MHTENLLKLANHLASLPKDYSHFNMSQFFAKTVIPGTLLPYSCAYTIDDIRKKNIKITDCNTVACAVGHAYALGIGDKNAYDWETYSYDAFDLTEDEWDWCFSAAWKSIDNTPIGAAKRIYYLIENEVSKDLTEILWKYDKQEYEDIIKDVKIPTQ